MRDDVEIRPARLADCTGLAAAWREFGRTYVQFDATEFRVPDEEGLDAWFESRLRADEGDDANWLVAERERALIGFAHAEIWHPAGDAERQLLREVAEPILKVDSLMVLEEERERGIGTTLMRALEDWGRGRGATRALVVAAVSSAAAVGFYENRMKYERRTIGFSKRL